MSNTNGKNNSSKSKILAVALVVSMLAVQLPASRAHADENMLWKSGSDDLIIAIAFMTENAVEILDAAVMLNGAISGIGNFSYAVRGKKAPIAWRVYGYASSTINLVLGSLIMIKTHNNPDYPDNVAFTFGACQAGLGAAGLGVTIWTHALDDGTEQSLSVAPFVMPDKEGGVAVGAGLKLVGW